MIEIDITFETKFFIAMYSIRLYKHSRTIKEAMDTTGLWTIVS